MAYGPIAAGHTLSNLRRGQHYRNLTSARDKICSINSRIGEIESSLETASGTEIDKVREDLNDVKSAFKSVVVSIDDRVNQLEERAIAYDNIYADWEKKCSKKEVLATSETYSNSGFAYMLVVENKWRTKTTFELTADRVRWNEADGRMILTVKCKYTSVDEETGVHTIFSGEEYKEKGEKKVETSTRDYWVGQSGELTEVTYISQGK